MKSTIIISVLLTAFVCGAADEQGTDVKALYDAHQWFLLRAAVESTKATAFYRGAVACVFNDLSNAEPELNKVIASAPQSEEAFESHALLTNAYIRAGRYRQALAQLEKMLAIKSEDAGTKDALPLFAALGRYTDQVVTHRHSSTLRYKMKDGNLFLPIAVNEKPASYIVDTGANFSALSAGEARRLGLTIHGVTATGSDSAGGKVLAHLAVADKLTVGEFQLTNVAFLVLPEDRQPFVDLAPGERGVLGLPVLLALETLRWSTDGRFEIGFPSQPEIAGGSNLCFEGMTPVAEAGFQQSKLNLVVDTGATTTALWPAFAKDFASVVYQSGKKGSQKVTGVAGSAKVETITLPKLTFRLGGIDTILRPARIQLEPTASESQWFHGRLGLDLLSKNHRVTLDFHNLTLVLEYPGFSASRRNFERSSFTWDSAAFFMMCYLPVLAFRAARGTNPSRHPH